MAYNRNAYYPCDVCGWNSPMNAVRKDAKGVVTSLCPVHDTNKHDEDKGKALEKKREQFKDDFQKAFVGLDEAAIEDITTP